MNKYDSTVTEMRKAPGLETETNVRFWMLKGSAARKECSILIP